MVSNYHSTSVDGVPSRPVQMRSTRRGVETRERILDAAEQIFSQRGFAATRLDDIAAAVGIRKPSVIHHFVGKQELHAEVMNRIYEALLLETENTIDDQQNGLQRIFSIIDVWLNFVSARPTAGRLLLRSAADSTFVAAEMTPSTARLLSLWTESVKVALSREGSASTEALELLSLFSGAALMFVATHPLLAGHASPEANEQGLLEPFRTMLHQAVAAVVDPASSK